MKKPVCQRCRNKLHQKCSQCGIKTNLFKCLDGTNKCYRCKDNIKYYCNDCERPIKGHKRTYCEFCRSVALNKTRKALNCARFTKPEFELLFSSFVDWLELEVGPVRSAKLQNRFIEFFVVLQSAPSNWVENKYFLSTIDGGFFRKSSLPRRYFSSIGILFDDAVLQDSMHLRTIEKNLKWVESKATPHHFDIISTFFQGRIDASMQNEITLQTVRVESTAVRLFVATLVETDHIPQALRVFSARSPGHLNALSKFLSFLELALDKPIKLPDNILALRLAFLVNKSRDENLSNRPLQEYLSLALLILHSVVLPKQHALNYQKTHDGYLVNLEERLYWIPSPI